MASTLGEDGLLDDDDDDDEPVEEDDTVQTDIRRVEAFVTNI